MANHRWNWQLEDKYPISFEYIKVKDLWQVRAISCDQTMFTLATGDTKLKALENLVRKIRVMINTDPINFASQPSFYKGNPSL